MCTTSPLTFVSRPLQNCFSLIIAGTLHCIMFFIYIYTSSSPSQIRERLCVCLTLWQSSTIITVSKWSEVHFLPSMSPSILNYNPPPTKNQRGETNKSIYAPHLLTFKNIKCHIGLSYSLVEKPIIVI